MRPCWCGHNDFAPFSADYGRCVNCATLVSLKSLTDEQLAVVDDEVDFYGRQYWLKHQASDLGFPDIHDRARNDLTERNLHWLQALLKYRLPPASVVELGCAHGSFVALMKQCGFKASGVEMSAWVVEYGKRTFGIPVRVGPIENLQIRRGSLDVIALMDVLEHLPDPVATMRHCLGLLKPDGLLLIQTPEFQTSMLYDQLVEVGSPFLDQLKVDEHLYLFTRDSVRRLFSELGAEHLAFEPAIFAVYDMFFVVGRSPLQVHPKEEVDAALLDSPEGRMTLAMLDLRSRELALSGRLEVTESDRAARGRQVIELTGMLETAERDRAARGDQLATLAALLEKSEADRNARALQIASLTAALETSDADRAARGDQLSVLTALLEKSEADRSARAGQIAALTITLQEADRDRTSRADQVATLTALLDESETDRAARDEGLKKLTSALHRSEADLKARDTQVDALTAALDVVAGERASAAANYEALRQFAAAADADRTARAGQIETLARLLEEAEADRSARGEQILTLTGMLKASEADRDHRGEQLQTLNGMLRDRAVEDERRHAAVEALRGRVALVLAAGEADPAGHWPEIRNLVDDMVALW